MMLWHQVVVSRGAMMPRDIFTWHCHVGQCGEVTWHCVTHAAASCQLVVSCEIMTLCNVVMPRWVTCSVM